MIALRGIPSITIRVALSSARQQSGHRDRSIRTIRTTRIGASKDENAGKSAPIAPHVLLEISPTASASTARSAWREKAKLLHPDVIGSERGEQALLDLNEAYAAFLKSKGVRSRGAVGKEEDDDDESDVDDPFLPPLSFSDDDDDENDPTTPSVLFVDPFSIEGFDPFRFRELQELVRGRRATTADSAADVALEALSSAGVTRLPARSGVALVTERQARTLCDVVERSLETLAFENASYEVSTLLSRARAANASPRRRRKEREL